MKSIAYFVIPVGAALVAAAAFAAAPPGGGLQILDFKPAFADQMTMLIQPRHTKIWYAGSQQNWTMAAFELSELGSDLNRIATSIPKYRGTDVQSAVNSIMRGPLIAVNEAIKAKDSKKFAQTYDQLSAACNACHTGLDHPFIVIKRPEPGQYSDQDFRPQPQK